MLVLTGVRTKALNSFMWMGAGVGLVMNMYCEADRKKDSGSVKLAMDVMLRKRETARLQEAHAKRVAAAGESATPPPPQPNTSS